MMKTQLLGGTTVDKILELSNVESSLQGQGKYVGLYQAQDLR